jgi:hypothetical protein
MPDSHFPAEHGVQLVLNRRAELVSVNHKRQCDDRHQHHTDDYHRYQPEVFLHKSFLVNPSGRIRFMSVTFFPLCVGFPENVSSSTAATPMAVLVLDPQQVART